jgi:RimJ/RimL family protein N-acetyltransferase
VEFGVLKGQKVVLREKRLEDASKDYTWRSDDELARLDAAPTLRIPFENFLDSYADELARPSRRRRRFAIETLDGEHIGNCMYYNIDERKGAAEVGIMIGDREYWDQGHGSDVVTTLLDYIFSTTKLERVYLNTLEWNTRAQRCFEKCGFVRSKRQRRFHNNFITMDIYRSSWQHRTTLKDDQMIKEKQEG